MSKKTAGQPVKPKRGQKLNAPGVIYARYSSHAQKDISVEQQVEQCTALAAEYGIHIIEVYPDRAVSGRTDKRTHFQRMMRDAASGQFKYVIAWKSNRIGRNMLEALVNETRLQELGVRILYVEEDFDDTAAGRFAARSMMNVNQFYSENMAEDIRRGLYDNASNCMVTNGHLPYGYKRNDTLHYEIDEARAAVIREIFDRVASVEPFVDIFRSLNARGITTSYGKPWGRTSLNKILTNERYRGIYIYGDVRIEGGIPRIVSDELYFRVQEVLAMKKNPRGRHRSTADYLLTGKLYCGKCGSPMIGYSGTGRDGSLRHYYVCQRRRQEKSCDKQHVRRDDIERQVAQALKDVVLQDEVIEWLADQTVAYAAKQKEDSPLGLLEDQLADVKRGIKNLVSAIEQGIITPSTKERLQELEAEKARIEGSIAAAKADMIDVSRDELVDMLRSFRDGDVEDRRFQARLFEIFLGAVFLYDDEFKIVFLYTRDKNTLKIPLSSPPGSADPGPDGSYKENLDPPRRRGLHIVRDDVFLRRLSLIPSLLLSGSNPHRRASTRFCVGTGVFSGRRFLCRGTTVEMYMPVAQAMGFSLCILHSSFFILQPPTGFSE